MNRLLFVLDLPLYKCVAFWELNSSEYLRDDSKCFGHLNNGKLNQYNTKNTLQSLKNKDLIFI